MVGKRTFVGGQPVLADLESAGFDVDDDDFADIFRRFYQCANLLLIQLLTASADFFGTETGGWHF